MNLVIVSGMFVCSSCLISVCMFIVSKALLISSATVIVSTGDANWLDPFAAVLFIVCNAVTVEFCTRVVWVCFVCLLLCKEEGSSPMSAITERRDIGLYEVPLFVSLLGFGIGTMLTNFHMCGIMLLLRAVLNMLVRNAIQSGPMYCRCLLFSLRTL